MTAKLTGLLTVCLSAEQEQAVMMAAEFNGMKHSQFGRQAIVEKLVREKFLQHPMAKYAAATASNNAE